MKGLLVNLHRDERGVSVIETAFLLPVLITMLISVLQVGLYLQAQNAVRGVAGEMSRAMAVESQKQNQLSNRQIEDMALAVAVSPPYVLKSSQLEVTVDDSTTQDIDRVRKIDINMNYTVPNLLGFAKWGVLDIIYTRQVFVPYADPMPESGTEEDTTGETTGDTGGDTGGDLGTV
ncbi:MAG TPA: TadE/TadG family type IV pilus assembly protein [Croceicoccus sp.]|nr:TadE/TadG family type IV pilus assembly protein [Croceicoccus sp.]